MSTKKFEILFHNGNMREREIERGKRERGRKILESMFSAKEKRD